MTNSKLDKGVTKLMCEMRDDLSSTIGFGDTQHKYKNIYLSNRKI